MPIVTYKKGSSEFIRWQGYVNGRLKQIHCGIAGVLENEKKALKLEIDYLEDYIVRTQSELYEKKMELEELKAKLDALETGS
jgi:septal ring factor EnvC (AmiA/AmiB activator)